MITMEDNPLQRYLTDNPEARRKRENRTTLREKRREDAFVNKYIQIKHPSIYTEANNMYKSFAEKYPGRADLTKTYFFKKWEGQIKSAGTQQQPQLYVPFLPILSDLSNATNPRVEIVDEGQQSQEETVVQEAPQTPPQEAPQTPPQEAPQTPPQEAPQTPPQEAPQTPPQEPESNDNFSGMSLNDMNIAAEEIISAIQSDRELMDIVENFDLPQSVWDNELALPDYVLEGDLEW